MNAKALRNGVAAGLATVATTLIGTVAMANATGAAPSTDWMSVLGGAIAVTFAGYWGTCYMDGEFSPKGDNMQPEDADARPDGDDGMD